MTSILFQERANELGHGITTEITENCTDDNCAAHPHLDSLKNI
jgi:hypothetical protein